MLVLFFSLTSLVHRFILQQVLREKLVYFLVMGTPLPPDLLESWD